MTHITLSTPEVRAVLDGSKTQFRKVLKPQPSVRADSVSVCREEWMSEGPSRKGGRLQWDPWRKLTYAPGDEVWVREAWNIFELTQDGDTATPVKTVPSYREFRDAEDLAVRGYWHLIHRANCVERGFDDGPKWRSPVTMPRWASRITLLVKSVRVERLQDISEADAIAEGIRQYGRFYGMDSTHWDDAELSATRAFEGFWIFRHGAASWDANPWVEVVEFERSV